ncbi:MAG: DNA repair and recombination protein RadB [Candidatus Thermoplasmatota archaeon]|nr:DNA repair and recombination protein RadB [Candidatus Thermoplasmatota archaeon]
MKRLLLNCNPLDRLLGGGVEEGTITEIYGEAGSGKTNFCLQATRECIASGEKVAYIDADGISIERLRQLCDGYDYKKILSHTLFFTPTSFEEQEQMVTKAINIDGIGMVIIDSFNMFYRMALEYDEEGVNRALNRQITTLQVAARTKGFYVILAGQVYSTEDHDVLPFAGRGIEHIAKTIVKFERVGIGKRQATIMKHRSQPEGKTAMFTITQHGLE